MEQRTRHHLAMAERNQAFALTLAADGADSTAQQWAVVVGFYAAVHYVNAFLWEIARIDPANHEERALLMSRWAGVAGAVPSYRRMLRLSFQARYEPVFRIDDRLLHRQLTVDLPAVEHAIRSLLPSI